MTELAQTNLQLFGQLQGGDYSADDRRSIQNAYSLATMLFPNPRASDFGDGLPGGIRPERQSILKRRVARKLGGDVLTERLSYWVRRNEEAKLPSGFQAGATGASYSVAVGFQEKE